jgi:hypothetical protein
MGDFSDLERGQIVGARLAGAYVIKNILLDVLDVWSGKQACFVTHHK